MICLFSFIVLIFLMSPCRNHLQRDNFQRGNMACCKVSNCQTLVQCDTEVIDILRQHNVISQEKLCPKCGKACSIKYRSRSDISFICEGNATSAAAKKLNNQRCAFSETVRKNTWQSCKNRGNESGMQQIQLCRIVEGKRQQTLFDRASEV